MTDTDESIRILPIITASLLLITLMLAVSIYGWRTVPADTEVPIHWNARGEVDDYAGPGFAFGLMPILAAALSAMVVIIAKLDPRRSHMAKNGRILGLLWMTILGVLAMIHGGVVWAGTGHDVDLTCISGVGVGGLFLVLGNFLGKVRSNFIMGVRTPWTVSSEHSWNKTHRLAGRLFVLYGVVIMVTALASGEAMVFVIFAGTILVAAILIAYSYYAWKHDPGRACAN